MKLFKPSLFFILLLSKVCFSQVGINTVNPSNASVLDVKSSSNNITFGGFLPPRVTLSQRNDIPASSSDDGMIIFLTEPGLRCLQIYNAQEAQWEDVYCMQNDTFATVLQDFDGNTDWTYTNTPAFYNAGNDVWDIVNNLIHINNFGGNFLGCRDLNNTSGGGGFAHRILFENVDITGQTNIKLAFDYNIYQFDNADDVTYEVFYDDVSQGEIILLEGNANLSSSGTVTLNIPDNVNFVKLTLSISQNGDDDQAGFDNFRVFRE
ncbi:hypothetical protein ACFQ3R_00910 [Mesonia ostreae]|uniref:Uncharacterized protein n=1 Tax=Mesonia ostreae TaxID=861110 RepID=A0ABU2KHR5_9FLAO|nr:hypothetical protein [Mesonia ostreae]MDT0294241.1 hypothetical protein [Mesonia ostreae]